jgi:hypothetical protein
METLVAVWTQHLLQLQKTDREEKNRQTDGNNYYIGQLTTCLNSWDYFRERREELLSQIKAFSNSGEYFSGADKLGEKTIRSAQ